MTTKELQDREEQAKKITLIETGIRQRLEALDCDRFTPDREAGVMAMSIPEIETLVADLSRVPTGREAISMIIAAYHNSKEAKRAEEQRAFDANNERAKVEMNPS